MVKQLNKYAVPIVYFSCPETSCQMPEGVSQTQTHIQSYQDFVFCRIGKYTVFAHKCTNRD